MIRPATLLDAALTVREALERLARNGLWLTPDHPTAARHLREYVDTVKAAAARAIGDGRPARGGDAPPVPRPDPASLDVAEAARLLVRMSDEARVAVRREEGVTVYWYAMRAVDLLHTLYDKPDDMPLRVALDLHETGSVPAQQVREQTDLDALRHGVALRGQELLGVIDPPMPKAARPPAAGGDRGIAPLPPPAAPPRAGAPPPPPAPAAAPGEPPAAAPVVEAYPDVTIPAHPDHVVLVGIPFDLRVGLRGDPPPDAPATGRMVLRGRAGATTIPVEVQVIADGFQPLDGWTRMLDVAVADPTTASVEIRLTPLPQDANTRQTSLVVQFVVDGVTCGTHSHHVVVARGAGNVPRADDRGVAWTGEQPPPPALTLGASASTPDVELNIAKPDGNPAKGTYLCTMRNAHGIPVDRTPVEISLGDEARTFATTIVEDMRLWDGDPALETLFAGHSATIAGKLPRSFWEMLHSVAARVPDRPLTLQLNSADPYVPWELALMEPRLDPARPPILAAQVVMGRWILGDSAVAAPPREQVKVKKIAAMAGKYNAIATGLRRLPEAEAEVQDLEAKFRATTYAGDSTSLKALLDASIGGGAQVVHFAGHGQVGVTRPGDAAIYLDNGKPLSPIFFRKTNLGAQHAPLIFFNACMVGVAGEMLGDYGGFPGNCLAGGFTALVAPLWAVNDTVAHWIALQFYDRALAAPARPVAEVLRELRANYTANPTVSSYLAYVYYGNPNLKVEWA